MKAPLKDPNQLLQNLQGSYDFSEVRRLFNLGANIKRFYPRSDEDAFEDLPFDLKTLILSAEKEIILSDLDQVIGDLSWASLGYRPSVCRSQKIQTTKSGFSLTIGIIETEYESEDVITGIREVLDIPSWSERDAVLAQESAQLLLITAIRVGLNEANLTDLDVLSSGDRFSANVSHMLKLEVIHREELELAVGKEKLQDNEFIGLLSFDESSILRPDGTFTFEIFERLKTQISLIQAQQELSNT